MTEQEEIEIFYRFCGKQDPHAEHLFYRDFGMKDGGADYKCLGWMIWQL